MFDIENASPLPTTLSKITLSEFAVGLFAEVFVILAGFAVGKAGLAVAGQADEAMGCGIEARHPVSAVGVFLARFLA